MISYTLSNISKGDVANPVTKSKNKYNFNYPCKSHTDCTDYNLTLFPGVYLIELYGASGGCYPGRTSLYQDTQGNCPYNEASISVGTNINCTQEQSRCGSGGYISGVLSLSRRSHAFLTLGGNGIYSYTASLDVSLDYTPPYMVRGGYGGGGSGANFDSSMPGTGSGGGQTSVSFDENDLWHRVLVSGAGGGADNFDGIYHGLDDGSGGSGGGLTAQGWWNDGVYVGNYLANSTFGFTFGSGEAARESGSLNPNGVRTGAGASDRPGAGAGWFGGFAGQFGNGGSGGGSSWALTKDAIIPQGNIDARDEFYEIIGSHKYAFTKNSPYIFENVEHIPGVWQGNGKAIITILRNSPINLVCSCILGYERANNMFSILPFIYLSD